MSQLYRLDGMKILVMKADSLTAEEIQELLCGFNFSSMININILDQELLRIYIIFLQKLSNHDVFYERRKVIKHTLNFIEHVFQSLKDVQSDEILLHLLELLKVILYKSTNKEHLKELFQNKKMRLFHLASTIIKLNVFNIRHAKDFTWTLCGIILIDEPPLPDSNANIIADVFDILTEWRVLHAAELSMIIIKRFDLESEIFHTCAKWLLMYGPNILVMNNNEKFTLKMLQALNNFFSVYETKTSSNFNVNLQNSIDFCMQNSYSKYELKITSSNCKMSLRKSIDYCIQKLAQNSQIFVSFFTNPYLRRDAIQLFSFVLLTYNDECNFNFLYNKIMELPVEPSEWVNTNDPELFLRICYIFLKNNSVIWNPSKILDVISSLIYSHHRYHLRTNIVKIIIFLYPILILESNTKPDAILGNDLILILSKEYYKLSEVFSLHVCQLDWILRGKQYKLKKAIICFWLAKGENFDLLKKSIFSCKAQPILIRIIMNNNIDLQITTRAAELLETIKDDNFKIRIAKTLPRLCDDPRVFNRLMISNPGIPQNKTLAIRIYEFMLSSFVYIIDETIFGLAVDYTKNLASHLRTDENVVNMFCRDHTNVKYILKRLNTLKGVSVMKTVGLLKVLLLVQVRNSTDIENVLEIDIARILKGSTEELKKCLELVHMLTRHSVFIRLSRKTIYSVFLKLCWFTEESELSVAAMTCLKQILKTNPWLATESTPNYILERYCSLAVNPKSCFEFVEVLQVWIDILKKELPVQEPFFMADIGIVKNYIKRVPDLPENTEKLLLTSLGELAKKKVNLLI